jgi:putative copper export protein
VLRGTLLTIHLLAVVVWLGGGLYDLFLVRELKRQRGTPAEVTLARVYVRYGPVIVAAVVVVAVTGALQASLLGWGYFAQLWLGLKQALMGLVLVALAAVMPTFARLGRVVGSLPESATELSEEARALFSRTEPYILVMRVAGFAALVLAAFRPDSLHW